MPQPCIFCSSELRASIEEKLASGALTQVEAANLLGCGRASVQRHIKNHMPRAIREAIRLAPRALKSDELASGLDVGRQLVESHGDLRELFKIALERGDIRTALRALEVEIKQLEFNAKLMGLYTDAPQVALIMNTEFVQLKRVIIESLKEYPEALPAVSARLDQIIEGYDSDGSEQEG